MAIGRELGIHESELLELEYAALMHDIGQLSLHDPIPGGATVLVSRQDQQRIAELGADVIQQAQPLASVAEIVRRQNEPYRAVDMGSGGAGCGRPSGPPLSSRIIKAANAFDDLVGSSPDPGRAAAAVQRLRLDTASEYDPDTVEACTPASSPAEPLRKQKPSSAESGESSSRSGIRIQPGRAKIATSARRPSRK